MLGVKDGECKEPTWKASHSPGPISGASLLFQRPRTPWPLAVSMHTGHTPVTGSHSSSGCRMLTQLAAHTVPPLQAQQVRVDVRQLAQCQQLQHARGTAS